MSTSVRRRRVVAVVLGGVLGLTAASRAADAGAGDAGASAATGGAPMRPVALPVILPGAHIRVLPRAANGRAYQLYVGLPASYDAQPGKRYPTLYICDGYWDFGLLRGIYGNLTYDKAIPELIVIGIGYAGDKPDFDVLRRYDDTPVPDPMDKEGKQSGHARAFLDVIEKELIPFVEREYRVDPSYRALGGSSLGGLFALYAMLERPALFKAYIAPSPAVEWAKDWLFRREEELAAKRKELPVRLFMSGAGEERPGYLAAVQRFGETLQRRGYAGLVYKYRLVDGERHSGTKAESYTRGLRFAFAPLAPAPTEK